MAITSLVDLANVFSSSGNRATGSTGKSSVIATLLGVNGGERLFPSAVDIGGLSQAIDLQSNALALRTASNQIAQSGSLLQVAGQGADAVQTQFEQLQALAAQAAKSETTQAQRQGLQKQADALLQASDAAVSSHTFQNNALLDGGFGNSAISNALSITLPDLRSFTLL